MIDRIKAVVRNFRIGWASDCWRPLPERVRRQLRGAWRMWWVFPSWVAAETEQRRAEQAG